MKALHFGAGNIGRGFIGRALSKSGYNVIFSDVNQEIIDAINYHKKYSVKLVGKKKETLVHVKGITAINFNDPNIFSIISSVDLITTAVGPRVLNDIVDILIKGILLKIQIDSVNCLNIIACENKIQSSSYIKKRIFKILPVKFHDYLKKFVGFIDCSIDTIIPSIEQQQTPSLSLLAEDFHEWIVDSDQFIGKIPKIIDMQYSKNLNAFIERKFFTLNTGHAVAAYLGLMKKYKTIQEAIQDKEIRNIVHGAMKESGSILIHRHHFNKKVHWSYINKIILRFENPFLSDQLERIARNPLQKLSLNERLMKPFLDSIEHNFSYFNLAKGIAALLHYNNKRDDESMQINYLIQKKGIKKALLHIFKIPIYEQGMLAILAEYMFFIKK